MIDFQYKLPAQNIEGRRNGTYNNTELAIPGVLTTTSSDLGVFMHVLRKNIYSGRSLVFIDGKKLTVNKNWIRDHVHVMKGMKYFEYDLNSFLDFIIETQREDGQFYELIKQCDDYHWSFVNEDCRVMYPDDNLSLVRLELEADIEYLVVEGAMQYYRATGDDKWLCRVLPKLEKGIDYITSDPKRFDQEHGLVKRPFTMDTWDFTPEERSPRDRSIHGDEKMSIMHGDNSGVYQAMNQLAFFNRKMGNAQKAEEWEKRAEILRQNMFKHLWNGKFFIHQLHLNHNGIDDKENIRLSLSATYDINRGVTSTDQSRATIEEYISRRKTTDKFAEWFTIDPPYSAFGQYKDGEYLNGAISPFTAGELAKAAFNNGYEEYGWSIIERFMQMVKRDGDVYFLYYPDSTPQPNGGPSTWGAAALLSAIDEGLAGIIDTDSGYKKINFSPKFPATPYTELRYFTGYEKTGAIVDVKFIITDKGMRYEIKSPAKEINAHIYIPGEKNISEITVNGTKTGFAISEAGKSKYADFATNADGYINIELIWK